MYVASRGGTPSAGKHLPASYTVYAGAHRFRNWYIGPRGRRPGDAGPAAPHCHSPCRGVAEDSVVRRLTLLWRILTHGEIHSAADNGWVFFGNYVRTYSVHFLR